MLGSGRCYRLKLKALLLLLFVWMGFVVKNDFRKETFDCNNPVNGFHLNSLRIDCTIKIIKLWKCFFAFYWIFTQMSQLKATKIMD